MSERSMPDKRLTPYRIQHRRTVLLMLDRYGDFGQDNLDQEQGAGVILESQEFSASCTGH